MSFEKNNYQIVRNAITGDLLKYMQTIVDMHETLFSYVKPPTKEIPFPYGDSQTPNSFAWYSTLHTDSLLKFLRPKISDITGKNLVEAYSYYRSYYEGAILEKHTDRPSCQYSATLCIKKGRIDWPIYFNDKNGNTVDVEMNDGDMIVYKGDELEHWRDPYKGDRHSQVFLHYVDRMGPYGESNLFDGRPGLGFPASSKDKNIK